MPHGGSRKGAGRPPLTLEQLDHRWAIGARCEELHLADKGAKLLAQKSHLRQQFKFVWSRRFDAAKRRGTEPQFEEQWREAKEQLERRLASLKPKRPKAITGEDLRGAIVETVRQEFRTTKRIVERAWDMIRKDKRKRKKIT